MNKRKTLQDVLTSKQFRVALLVTSGMKNIQIAMIMRTTENVVKNILREVYDRSGCSNRVELALLVVHEAKLSMYEPEKLSEELLTLRGLSQGLDEELIVNFDEELMLDLAAA